MHHEQCVRNTIFRPKYNNIRVKKNLASIIINIFGLKLFGEYRYKYTRIAVFKQTQMQRYLSLQKLANMNKNMIIWTYNRNYKDKYELYQEHS